MIKCSEKEVGNYVFEDRDWLFSLYLFFKLECIFFFFFFFKQKTAYEMCGRDWSSDVCSSDLMVATRQIILI